MRELHHWPPIAGMSPQSHCGDEENGCIRLSSWRHCICIMLFALCMLSTLCVMNQFLFWLINIFTLLAQCLLGTLLVLILTMHELYHWPSIASMSPQSHCGDEEDGRIGLSSWRHYICIMLFALCMLSTLCVMNQLLINWYIYALSLVLVEHSVGSNTNNAWTPPLAVCP